MAGMTKQWNVVSPNPRPSHADMDGEQVGIHETFSNGMRFPGDPEADVDEVAGCTCVLTIDGTAAPVARELSQDQIRGWGQENYGEWARSLPDVQRAAVRDYTDWPFNKFLRADGMSSDTSLAETLKPKVLAMDEALANAQLPEDIQMFRLTDKKLFASLKSGEFFSDKGFTSTTLSREFAESNLGWNSDIEDSLLLEIQVPKGYGGGYVGYGTNVSGFPSQYEFILPRNTVFEIVKNDATGTILKVVPKR